MAGKRLDVGPIGVGVTHNLRALREGQNLSYSELSRRVAAVGRDINGLGLRRMEAGLRKVDVDDLVALALALGVSPATLLMPPAADAVERVEITGAVDKCDAEQFWNWLCTQNPIDPDVETVEFMMAALPPWKKRELLAALEPVNIWNLALAAKRENEAK